MTETPTPAEKPASSGSSIVGRLVIAGFMGAVVLAECGLAYVLIPDARTVLAQAEQAAESETSDQAEKPADSKPVVEIELGQFGVTSHQPATGTTLRVDFLLVGTTLQGDESRFRDLLARNQHRFRDLVIVEIRNSESTDLTDAGLGLIKRRILEKSNALFGQPILRSVFFSDYTYIDQ